jgi:hypothetical protein
MKFSIILSYLVVFTTAEFCGDIFEPTATCDTVYLYLDYNF